MFAGFTCKYGFFLRELYASVCSACVVKCFCLYNREDKSWGG